MPDCARCGQWYEPGFGHGRKYCDAVCARLDKNERNRQRVAKIVLQRAIDGLCDRCGVRPPGNGLSSTCRQCENAKRGRPRDAVTRTYRGRTNVEKA